MERIRADALALGFAEVAKLDACRSYLSGQISVQAYSEVEQAYQRVCRIYVTGKRAVESP